MFLRNRLREFVPAINASIMAKFEQIRCERFRDILKRSFKHHKNSEISYYPHTWLNFKNVASSHNFLIPLQTAYKKERRIALGDRE